MRFKSAFCAAALTAVGPKIDDKNSAVALAVVFPNADDPNTGLAANVEANTLGNSVSAGSTLAYSLSKRK